MSLSTSISSSTWQAIAFRIHTYKFMPGIHIPQVFKQHKSYKTTISFINNKYIASPWILFIICYNFLFHYKFLDAFVWERFLCNVLFELLDLILFFLFSRLIQISAFLLNRTLLLIRKFWMLPLEGCTGMLVNSRVFLLNSFYQMTGCCQVFFLVITSFFLNKTDLDLLASFQCGIFIFKIISLLVFRWHLLSWHYEIPISLLQVLLMFALHFAHRIGC